MGVDDKLANLGHHALHFGEISACNNSMNAWMVQGFVDVDRSDDRMSVRAAQYFSMKHPGHRIIGTVQRMASYLFEPVVPDGTSADDSKVSIAGSIRIRHWKHLPRGDTRKRKDESAKISHSHLARMGQSSSLIFQPPPRAG